MNFLEAHQQFREIEDEMDLFDFHVQDFPVWDYLRVPLGSEFFEKTGTFKKPHRNPVRTNLQMHIQGRYDYLKEVLCHNPFFKAGCDYLFIGHQRRKMQADNTYWDLYSDPVIDFLGRQKCLLLEEIYQPNRRHLRPAHTERIVSADIFCLVQSLYGFIRKPLNLTERNLEVIEQFEQAYTRLTDCDLDLIPRLNKYYNKHVVTKNLFGKILDKLNPKAVFLVCSYGREAYILACRARGIPTIELQHGTISEYHLGYSYPAGTHKSSFPDYFFSFGRFWEDSVPLPLPSDHIVPIGYPCFDIQKRSYANIQKEKNILFLSQGSIGAQLARFAVDLNERLPPDWNVIYKLHPGEVAGWQERYHELAQSAVRVVHGDEPPLYELMSKASIQVGVYSTALFEGLAFDCQTYIVDLPGHEYMQPLINNGVCQLVKAPSAIDLNSDTASAKFQNDYIFANNWEHNLLRAMSKLGLG